MKEQFGISNIELKLFESYLSDREQVSFVNGAMSAPKRIVCGDIFIWDTPSWITVAFHIMYI